MTTGDQEAELRVAVDPDPASPADLVRRIVKVRDKEVKLSPKEYELLRVLVQHAGKVLTHKFLLGELWDSLTDAQYLRVYVRQLRQKIELEQLRFILTIPGVGYRFNDD